jgi:hypothetical protein
VLAAVIASALIVSMQLPFLNQQPTVHLSLHSYSSFEYRPPPLVWPSDGSAAIDVPALGITIAMHNRVVPHRESHQDDDGLRGPPEDSRWLSAKPVRASW